MVYAQWCMMWLLHTQNSAHEFFCLCFELSICWRRPAALLMGINPRLPPIMQLRSTCLSNACMQHVTNAAAQTSFALCTCFPRYEQRLVVFTQPERVCSLLRGFYLQLLACAHSLGSNIHTINYLLHQQCR